MIAIRCYLELASRFSHQALTNHAVSYGFDVRLITTFSKVYLNSPGTITLFGIVKGFLYQDISLCTLHRPWAWRQA